MKNTVDPAFEPLWKDRKRTIFGLPWSFTRYEVTEDRLVTHRGLFNTVTDEILLYRVLDIKLVRKFSQKLNGVGSIILYSADRSDGEIELKNIRKPDAVRRFLSKVVEQERVAKGITGREMFGAAASAHGGMREFVDLDGDGIPD